MYYLPEVLSVGNDDVVPNLVAEDLIEIIDCDNDMKDCTNVPVLPDIWIDVVFSFFTVAFKDTGTVTVDIMLGAANNCNKIIILISWSSHQGSRYLVWWWMNARLYWVYFVLLYINQLCLDLQLHDAVCSFRKTHGLVR